MIFIASICALLIVLEKSGDAGRCNRSMLA